MSNDNVISLFAKKNLEDSKETPEEIVARFHLKLDEVLAEFQSFSVMENFEVMQSVVEMNKQVFSLYMDLKRRNKNLMKAFVVTHVELGWDSVLAVFAAKEAAKEYVDWYSMYTISPKDVLVIHEQDYNLEFKEEDFK